MWSYSKEQVKAFGDYGVEILHRVESAQIRLKPKAGAKPVDGEYQRDDMEPDRDPFGAFQTSGAPKHWAELRDLTTGTIYIAESGTDAQEATEKAVAKLAVTPKPKTRQQVLAEQGEKAHVAVLSEKDAQIDDLKARLEKMEAMILSGQGQGREEAANGGTGVMVAKAKRTG